ncbi:MAG: 4Fe-4S dicluster domain-containing protein [Thermincola sp.]|jgi:Fe-S-cluster-containing dehydrogenase component|nr:4Fe-4S dicluster domain-containing protein [Thermincola sp.]MDT3701890.1 4Fe-4S dicluster domain-containing protein [Thermincola sp.]
MPRQIGFLVDLSKCTGCHSCEFACKNENQLGDFRYRRVMEFGPENILSFLSMACNHCANPECVRVCPNKCFNKRKDGIVFHDPTNCDSCSSCVSACPFKVPQINPYTKKVSKCNFCMSRIHQGLEPACVSACANEALQVINLSEPLPPQYIEVITCFPSVYLTKPSIRFILPKVTVSFWRNS